uniref:protein FAM200C-like n=1 Tax=Myxine glutinosa TaxID=7769 RepID=UPI00358ECE95
MLSKKRKYDDSYIKWGFMKFVEKDGTERPQCVLCYKVLAEASIKPSKLKAHLASTHPTHQNDSEDVFRSKKARFMAKGSLTRHGFQPSTKPILEASYEVALLIAKDKKAHTIGETLVKPCAVVMANLVTQELRESRCRFSLQLDESTDVASCSQLLVFARYLVGFAVKEEFLFCSPLKTTTKSVDIMNVVNHFMEENGIEWTKLGSLCTDGAPAIMGKRSGFVALVKDKCPDVIVTHCVLHRHALATKPLPKELGDVMAIVVTAVNFIRTRALNHRLFQVFCEDIGAAYTHLLYYTEVRWLSRGQILNCVLQLRQEIEIFLREKGNDSADYFGDPVFVARLVYISDIFGHLNALNISLQGSSLTIVEAAERINSLREKLRLWSNRVEKLSFVNFPELAQILADDDAQNDFCPTLVVDIKGHLKSLSDSFDGYFPNLLVDPWIQDPFTILIDDIDDDNELKDDLIELKASGRLKMQFSTIASPSEFWASNYEAFPNLAAKALRMTLPFVTTYLCEAGFSALVVMKTKLRARLDIGPDMRVALSKTAPRIKRLVEEKQEHPSHRV